VTVAGCNSVSRDTELMLFHFRGIVPLMADDAGLVVIESVAAPLAIARTNNSHSGTANSASPQFKQTDISGKTQTVGLSRFLSPGKWMASSPTNLLSFANPHDRHTMIRPSKVEQHTNKVLWAVLLAHSASHRTHYACRRENLFPLNGEQPKEVCI
jgi:hypothetical protein